MHEYSIVQALVDSVEQHVAGTGVAPALRVRHIRIEIGSLSGVSMELLQTAYETFREGTICAGAALEITPVDAQWACPRCDAIIERGGVLRCTSCDAAAVLTRGDEIVLRQIELGDANDETTDSVREGVADVPGHAA
jgi:hydrogenase nickel incorporation protein HypA/HybF